LRIAGNVPTDVVEILSRLGRPDYSRHCAICRRISSCVIV
jgi:hypothetical protein